MSTRRRVLAWNAVVLSIVLVPALAQAPKSEPVTPPADSRNGQDPSRQVPPFFGQIGLSTDQRAKIYAIQAKHQAKVDELEAEIRRIKAQMLDECESTLTATQKDLLTRRRAIDQERRKAEAVKSKDAKATKPGDPEPRADQ